MFIRKRIAPAFLVIAAAIIFMMTLGAAPVHAEEKTIGAVYVTCNAEQWYIMLNKNGNDNYDRIRNHIDVRGAGVEYTNSGNLTKHSIEGQFWGVNSDPIVPEGEYYISFRLSAEDGYVWSDGVIAAYVPVPVTDAVGLRVYFNGSRCTEAYIENYLGDAVLNIPIYNDISTANVLLSNTRLVYNGKKQGPAVKKAILKGATLTSKNYKITYHDMSNQEVAPIKPGKYYVRLTGKGVYGGEVQAPFTIIRPNTMKVAGKTAKIKYAKLQKKAQTINPGKAIIVSSAKGKVTFKLTSAKKGKKTIKLSKAKKYFTINPANGAIKVKKKLGKGTYTLKVSVTAAGTKDYGAATRTVTVKVKIK